MPHLYPQANDAALGAIMKFFRNPGDPIEELPVIMPTIIAGRFNHFTGERLEAGKQCICHPITKRSSAPFDFLLIVEADWTPQRSEHFEKIEDDIRGVVHCWMPDLKAEAHLVVGWRPTRLQVAAMNLADFFAGDPRYSARIAGIFHSSGITTVSDLLFQAERHGLDVIEGIAGGSIYFIKKRLETVGIELTERS